MKKSRKPTDHIKSPNIPALVCLWLVGLGLFAFCITAITLDIWHVGITLFVLLITAGVLIYAFYGTAKITNLPARAKQWALKHKVTALFVTNYNYRTAINACLSVVIDFTYAIFSIVIGYKSGSAWFKTNGTYYILLGALRFNIIMFGARPMIKIKDPDKRKEHSIKVYTASGMALFAFNVTLTALFDIMLASESIFAKHRIIIYGSYIYTTYKIILAVYGLVKSRKNPNLITRSLRNVNAITALVSVLTFMTSLLATFPAARSLAYVNGFVGNFISLTVIAMSISMIVGSYRHYTALEKSRKLGEKPSDAAETAPTANPLFGGDAENKR